MFSIIRGTILFFIIAILFCVIKYVFTGNRRWLKWSKGFSVLLLGFGLTFVALLFIERLT